MSNFTSAFTGPEIDERLGLAATAAQPVDLAAVATSGDYADLLNKPAIGPSGSLELISTTTLSTEVGMVDFALDPQIYSKLILIANGYRHSSGQEIVFSFLSPAGVVISSNNVYTLFQTRTGLTSVELSTQATTSNIRLPVSGVWSSGHQAMEFEVLLSPSATTPVAKYLIGNSGTNRAAMGAISGPWFASPVAVGGLRLSPAANAINAGTFHLYGVKK